MWDTITFFALYNTKKVAEAFKFSSKLFVPAKKTLRMEMLLTGQGTSRHILKLS
jgi:hypothetical protein